MNLDSEDDIRAAYEAGKAMGLPVIEGEHAHEGGYHYYPPLPQVREWITAAGLIALHEAEGDGYYHVIAQKLA